MIGIGCNNCASNGSELTRFSFFRNGTLIVLDGQSLTVAGVIAAARYGAPVALDQSPEIRERMAKSRDVLVGKVQASKSVYGVSTGLGGSGACDALISRVRSTKTP
jgi:histidine ammonia-lyase